MYVDEYSKKPQVACQWPAGCQILYYILFKTIGFSGPPLNIFIECGLKMHTNM